MYWLASARLLQALSLSYRIRVLQLPGSERRVLISQHQHATCVHHPYQIACTGLTVDIWYCRFVIIPDMLKNAPMFKRIDPKMKVHETAFCFTLCVWRWTAVC